MTPQEMQTALATCHFVDNAGDGPQDLKRLLRVAARALQAEDFALRQALASQVDILRRTGKSEEAKALSKEGQGLSYWVYETTLVYTIWKAWLYEAPVEWEKADTDAERRGKRWFDLHVDWGDGPALVEAKWWNDSSRKHLKSIENDLKKLQDGTPTAKLMVAFWWGKVGELADDIGAANTSMKSNKWCPAYAAAFRAHSAFAEDNGYFAMGAWQPAEK